MQQNLLMKWFTQGIVGIFMFIIVDKFDASLCENLKEKEYVKFCVFQYVFLLSSVAGKPAYSLFDTDRAIPTRSMTLNCILAVCYL